MIVVGPYNLATGLINADAKAIQGGIVMLVLAVGITAGALSDTDAV